VVAAVATCLASKEKAGDCREAEMRSAVPSAWGRAGRPVSDWLSDDACDSRWTFIDIGGLSMQVDAIEGAGG
jgi:hypothetical protein